MRRRPRTDGPADCVAHGYLSHGPVTLFAADVALLGTPSPATLPTGHAARRSGMI
jgi:hypothetical protein